MAQNFDGGIWKLTDELAAENKALKSLIAAAVLSNGGELVVSNVSIQSVDNTTIVDIRNDADREAVIVTISEGVKNEG